MIGRKKEREELEELYKSGKAELVAIYGRRRIGKTLLVNETFEGRITFHHAGLSPLEIGGKGAIIAQLSHFYSSLKYYGMQGNTKPENWFDAFYMLERLLDEKNDGSRQVVFLDEMPWLDTPRSSFITAFEGFWNTWACSRKNLMVIVCGSANSWIMDKLINNHGGLYGRVTREIKLVPFTMRECKDFLEEGGIRLSEYDIAQSYMIVGGIPYYLGYFKKGNSVAQNIDEMFFLRSSVLRDEFDRLFTSAFERPETIKQIVRFLYTRRSGYMRKEITDNTGLKEGEKLSECLNALIASDFVVKYVPFGKSKREVYYKLVDPFCLFYLHFVDNKDSLAVDFWKQNTSSQNVITWRGLAFENICFNHVKQIKEALGIRAVKTSESALVIKKDAQKMQLDMVITRDDNIVNMCEMKFYNREFLVDKAYYKELLERQDMLEEMIPPRMIVHNTLITTDGLKYNEYSTVFANVITLKDLFLL